MQRFSVNQIVVVQLSLGSGTKSVHFACAGVTFHRALFVPPLSSYTNLLTPSGGSSSPTKIQSAPAADGGGNVEDGDEEVSVLEERVAERQQRVPLPADSLSSVRGSFPALQWQHSIQRTWEDMQARAGDYKFHDSFHR